MILWGGLIFLVLNSLVERFMILFTFIILSIYYGNYRKLDKKSRGYK